MEGLSTKINTGDNRLLPIGSTLLPVFGDCRQNGNKLNIYESRDDPVTSNVISIQWQMKM